MNVKELIKELETFDKMLEVQCADSRWLYGIAGLKVSNFIHTAEPQPFCKILLRN